MPNTGCFDAMQNLAGRDAAMAAGASKHDPVRESGILPHPGFSAD